MRPEEGVEFAGAGVMGDGELSIIGAGNWTLVPQEERNGS